jgi:hypothetical protein
MERGATATWSGTWAFDIREPVASKEGYDRAQIAGSVALEEGYPGCPSCEQTGLATCGACHKASCWGGADEMHTCPWCHETSRIGGDITELQAGTDR